MADDSLHPLGIHELNIDFIEGQDRIDIDHEVLISYRGLDSMHGQNQGLWTISHRGQGNVAHRGRVARRISTRIRSIGRWACDRGGVRVSERPAYGGADYNGDGEISRDSDQFIELHNPSATSIDLTGWQLDDLRSGGSAPCSIASGTTIPPDGRLAFFRPDTGIELDYWEGDTVHLIDPQGTIVDAFTYPEADSDYGKAYIRTSEGALSKVDPSPGTAPGMNGTAVQARCDVILDDDIAPYILTGRIVPMTSESDVIDHGSMLIRDGQIDDRTDLPPAGVNLEGIPVHATSGTIFPDMIDSHNHPRPRSTLGSRNGWMGQQVPVAD